MPATTPASKFMSSRNNRLNRPIHLHRQREYPVKIKMRPAPAGMTAEQVWLQQRGLVAKAR